VPVPSSAATSASLVALMRSFDREGAVTSRLIGELLVADPDIFCEAAVQVLKAPDDTRAFQYVVGVLASHGLLLPILSHPGLNREEALVVARVAQRADPQVETAIAKRLADSANSGSPGISSKNAARLLEILSEISDGSKILPSLLRLLRHPDPHLRSKAVKMIGRGNPSAKWVQSRLIEADMRVRANAIESLWGVNTPEARELLQASVHDLDNRVAGNALVALHRIGDCAAIPDFFRMAAHELPRFRVTAAWAMGESGDPRFLEALAHLLRDEHRPVRTRALASLGRIKVVLAKSRQTVPWQVAGLVRDEPQKNLRRLQVAIAAGDGSEYPAALGTQFLVTEDSQPVVSYRATERRSPDILSVSFVFPRSAAPSSEPWVHGALSCRPWKRTSDWWGLQTYNPPEESAGIDRPSKSPPCLTSSLETMEAAFDQVAEPASCAGFWSAVLQAVMADYGTSRGKRHVIVFNRSEFDLPPPGDLTPSIVNGLQIQVVSTVDNPVLEDFCRSVRGVFRIARSPGEISQIVRSFYLNLSTHYEIAYSPVSAGCRTVKVRVQTVSGWGEAAFPVADGPVARWQVAERL
jgi:hypothetical protein